MTPIGRGDPARDLAITLGAAGAACSVAALLHVAAPAATPALTAVVAGLAIAGCTVVAVQSHVRWRLVGDAVSARLCIAYAVYGTVVVPLAANPSDGASGTVGQLLGTLAAAATLASILRCPDVVSRARLGTTAVLVGVLAAAAAVVVAAVPAAGERLEAPTVAGHPALEVAGALAIVGCAGAATAAGIRLQRRSLACTGMALILLVVAPAVASTGPTPPSAHLLASAIQAGVLAAVVPVAVADTRLALRAVGRDNSSLRDRWRDAVRRADGLSRQEAERSHELRSALLALEGASDVLRRHVEHLGEPEDAALAAALASELGRLRMLAARLPASRCEGFDVNAALMPVVLAHRACGQNIVLDVPTGLIAAGRPEALAEAVGNLLTNAAVHAPGSTVSITAQAGRTVRLVVADDGPGIDPARFTAPTHGLEVRPADGRLGLRLATRLVRDDGGDLAILGTRRGAAIAIDLPRGSHTGAEGCDRWTATAS